MVLGKKRLQTGGELMMTNALKPIAPKGNVKFNFFIKGLLYYDKKNHARRGF